MASHGHKPWHLVHKSHAEGPHQKGDFLTDIEERVQILAISCSEWVAIRRCCCCLPLANIGGYALCVWVLVRGLLRLNEVFGPVHLIMGYSTPSTLAYFARGLMTIAAFGDTTAASIGLLGLAMRKFRAMAVFFLWMWMSLSLRVLVTPIILTFDVPRAGTALAIMVSLLETALDMYFAVLAGILLLIVTYKGTVSEPAAEVLLASKVAAVQRNKSEVQTADFISSLLQDSLARDLLSSADLSMSRLDAATSAGGGTFGHDGEDSTALVTKRVRGVNFSSEVFALVAEAVQLKTEAGHPKLLVQHLVISLCSSGQVEEFAGGGSVNMKALLSKAGGPNRDEEGLGGEVYSGPPPCRVFKLFPIEECVLMLTVIQGIFDAASLMCFIFSGVGLVEWALGLRSVHITQWLELLTHLISLVFCGLTLSAVSKNRQARESVRGKAYYYGLRWGAELGDCFLAVLHDPMCSKWLKELYGSTRWLFGAFLWTIVEFFLEVPIYSILLVVGNMCGFYMSGLMAVSQLGAENFRVRIDCSRYDGLHVTCLALLLAMRFMYGVALLVQWHQYHHGWTTADAGVTALLPSVPEALIRAIAGLPPPWARGIEAALHTLRSCETSPLLAQK